MSYVYIKPGGFNIKNMIIKEYNNNLVLNYRDSNISITLKNIIFKITSNPIIIDDNKSDNKEIWKKIKRCSCKNTMLYNFYNVKYNYSSL